MSEVYLFPEGKIVTPVGYSPVTNKDIELARWSMRYNKEISNRTTMEEAFERARS